MASYWDIPSVSEWSKTFIPYIREQFGVGKEGSPYSMDVRTFKDFLRVRLEKQGEESPLVLDLAPGPMTPFGEGEAGRSVIQPSASSGGTYSRIFGPEIFIGGESPEDWYARTPMDAVTNYLKEVWDAPGRSIEGRWSVITGRGAGTAVGSLQQYGPVHSAIAQFEMASRVSVGFAPGVRDQSKVWQQINQWSRTGQHPFFSGLRGYAPWKGDDDVTRFRNLKASGQIWDAGDFDWNVYAFGSNAAKAVKHASVAFMGGVRETVDLMRPGAEGGLEVARPGFIVGQEDSVGYRMMNMVLSGGKPTPGVVRPGTAVTQAAPIPGAMISSRDVLREQGIYGAFRQGRQVEPIITPHIRELAQAEWDFGEFRKVTSDTGEISYQKIRDKLGGLIIPANQTSIIGTYSYKRDDRDVTLPIQVTAEGREIAFSDELKPNLVIPAGVLETNVEGYGHPGVFSEKEQSLIAAGKLPYTDLMDPNSPFYDARLFGGIVKAFQAAGGGTVTATGKEQPYLNIGKFTRVGIGAKSWGVKAGVVSMAEVFGVDTPKTIDVAGVQRTVNAILGEIKNPLPQFAAMMGAQPGRAMAQSLTELFPEAPAMGRYARLKAYQQEQMAMNVRRGLVSQEQALQNWPAISQDVLAEAYASTTGGEPEPWLMTEVWRQRFMRESLKNPKRYLEQFGYGIQAMPQWLTVGPVTAGEQEFYSSRFMLGLEQMGITGDDAQAELNKYYRFQEIEGRDDLRWWQMRTPLTYQTTATPVVPEDLWKGVRFGYEEIAALNMAFGRGSVEGGQQSIAEYLGMALDQPAEATGFMPPHAKAWRAMGQFYAYQFSQTDKTMPPPPDAAYHVSEEQMVQLESKLVPGLSMKEYEGIINEVLPEAASNDLLYYDATHQTLVRPRVIEAISEYEGAGEDLRPINKWAKRYYNVAYQWAGGGTYDTGEMAKFAGDLSAIAKMSSSKTLSKTLGARWLRQALGGRFTSATGMGLSTIVLSQERMDLALSQLIRAGGGSPNQYIKTGPGKKDRMRALDLARQQMEAAGGMPAIIGGEPTYGRESAVQAVNAITPSILSMRGIKYQEASRIAGGRVIPGGVETGGILAAFGPEMEALWRDFDLDPGYVSILGTWGKEGGLQIPAPDEPMMKEFQRRVNASPEEFSRISLEAIRAQGGEEAVAASGYIQSAMGIAGAGSGEEYIKSVRAPGITPMSTKDVYGGGVGWVEGKHGMGTAFNFRRWVEAAMGTLGFSEEEVGMAHTYGTKSYASFLEQTTKEGARHLETFMNSLIATTSKTGKGAMLMAKPQASIGHKDFRLEFGDQLAWQLKQTVMADKLVKPEYAVSLFSTAGTALQNVARLQAGEGAGDIISSLIMDKEFELTKTPIGLVAATEFATRMTGEFEGKPYVIKSGEFEGEFAMDIYGGQSIKYRGDEMSMRAFAEREDIQRTSMLFQALSGRGGILKGEQIADLADMIMKGGGEGAPQVRYMYQQLEAAKAHRSMAQAEASRVPFTDFSQLRRPPVLRPSTLGLATFVEGTAGIGHSAEQEAQWGIQQRARQIAKDVFGISEDVLKKVFPSTPAQIRGGEFEEWAGPRIIKQMDLAYAARGGEFGTIALQSQELGMRASFKPDIIGVMPSDVSPSGKPELIMPDIKHSSGGREDALAAGLSKGYGLQVGAYGMLVHEAATKLSPEKFQSAMTPFMQSAGIAEKDYQETARSWQEAAKNIVRTGLIPGYTDEGGNFQFAQPGKPFMEVAQSDWTNPAVQGLVHTGATNVTGWYTQQGIQDIAPFLMGALRGSGQYKSIPLAIRQQLEDVMGDRPEALIKAGTKIEFDFDKMFGGQVPPGGTGGGGRGGGTTGGGGDGGMGGFPFPAMGSDEFNNYWGAVGRAFIGGMPEGQVPLSLQHIYRGGAGRAEIMERTKWAEGVAAAVSLTGRQEFVSPGEAAGFTFDARMRGGGKWRDASGRMVPEEVVRQAVGPLDSPRLREIDEQLGDYRNRVAQAREAFEQEPSSSTAGAIGHPTARVRALEREREAEVKRVMRTVKSPGMSTETEKLVRTLSESAGAALGEDPRAIESTLRDTTKAALGDVIGRFAQGAPEEFAKFYAENRQYIQGGARALTKINLASQLLGYSKTIQAVSQEHPEDAKLIQQLAAGEGGLAASLEIARTVETQAGIAGLSKSTKAFAPMGAKEIEQMVGHLEKFGSALEDATKQIHENSSIRKKEVEAYRQMEEERYQISTKMRAPELARVKERLSLISSGQEEVTGEQFKELADEYMDLQGGQARDEERLRAARERAAPTRTQIGRLTRRALGGWGLMYMRALAGLPMGQAGYGYQASDEYLRQETVLASRYGGADIMYQSPEAAVTASQVRHGGATMAMTRELAAGIPAGARDIGAAGMAGVAGFAGLEFFAGAAGVGSPLGGALAAAAPYALPIAFAAFGALEGAAYMRHPERSVPTYAMAQLERRSPDFLTRFGANITTNWMDITTGGQMNRMSRDIAATSMYALQGVPYRRIAGQPVPDYIYGINRVAGAGGAVGVPGGYRVPGGPIPTVGNISPEQQIQVYTSMAYTDPRFRGIESEAASTMARWGIEGMNETYSLQDVANVARANYYGIDTPGMAGAALRAFRLPQTAAQATDIEKQLEGMRAPWEEATFRAGVGIAEQLPAGFVEAAFGAGVNQYMAANLLDRYAMGPNAEVLQQEAARWSMARERGDQYTPNLPGAMVSITPGDRRRRDIEAQRDAEATQAQIAARQAGLSERVYERYARRGQAQYQQTMRAISADLTAQTYGMQAGRIGGMMISGNMQQAGLAQGLVSQLPQMANLGMNTPFFQEMGMAGPGRAMALDRMMNVNQQAQAITGRNIAPTIQRAAQILGWQQGTNLWERAMSGDPYLITQMAQQGAFPGEMFGYDMNYLFAQSDINLQGQITGLSPLTTSLQVGGQAGIVTAANAWTGGNIESLVGSYASSPWRQAAVQGLGSTYQGMAVPQYMQGQGGMRALQWVQRQIGIQAQQAAAGAQLAQLALQGEYQPKFWAIEDKQRALAHRQALWGFEVQEQQFEMQGRQFYENIGLQQRQVGMQRQWARQDWAVQDQTRAMQWAWQVEDFEESARFMTGRDRRLAERQMERATIMHGVEGEQVDTQRERQRKLWALEDERHQMTITHFEEQRELQEENMKKQREFYEDGRELQEKMIKLQREYWQKQHDLAVAAAGAAAGFAKQMQEVQDDMEALAQKEEDRQGQLRVAQSRAVDMTNAIISGLNYIILKAPAALRSIVKAIDGNGSGIPIEPYNPDGGGTTTNKPKPTAQGGDVFPGQRVLVGERGPEILRLNTIGSVVNQYDLMAAQGMNDRWQSNAFLSIGGSTTTGGVPTSLTLYIGNEYLGRFVIDTVQKEIDV